MAYSVHDSYLRWVVTSEKHRPARELKDNIAWACGEVRGMMERADSQRMREEKKTEDAKAKL